MNDVEILDKVVDKAGKKGNELLGRILREWDDEQVYLSFVTLVETGLYQVLIFNHDFAKAFWGEKYDYYGLYDDDGVRIGELVWKFHLQEMVLMEEPLKYLERFLDD